MNEKKSRVEAMAEKLMKLSENERNHIIALMEMYLAGKAAGIAEAKKSA